MQVRDLDETVQQRLRDAAGREGISLSAFLRRELTRIADRIEVEAKLEGGGKRNAMGVRIGSLGMTTEEIVAELRERRGE